MFKPTCPDLRLKWTFCKINKLPGLKHKCVKISIDFEIGDFNFIITENQAEKGYRLAAKPHNGDDHP